MAKVFIIAIIDPFRTEDIEKLLSQQKSHLVNASSKRRIGLTKLYNSESQDNGSGHPLSLRWNLTVVFAGCGLRNVDFDPANTVRRRLTLPEGMSRVRKCGSGPRRRSRADRESPTQKLIHFDGCSLIREVGLAVVKLA